MFERRAKNNEMTASIAVGVAALLLAPLLVPKVRRGAKSVIKGGRNAYAEAITSVAALGELISKATPFKKRARSLRLRIRTPHRKRARLRRKSAGKRAAW
ncbi:MAG TPA: hypothetical protein VEU06_07815 [Micropepsaceae bacterium]|nr:hypothetical protein [Micropepsaceae bacterium]